VVEQTAEVAAAGPETERRRAIARRVVDHLAAHTDLRASLLAGSAAVGSADEHSDVDLLNYYEELPTPTAFTELMRGLDAEPLGEIGEPTPEGFGGRFRLAGVEVQTGGQLIAAIERRLARIAAGDVDWITAKVAMGLLEGLPLQGAPLLLEWQSRAAYPEALRRREAEANLGLFPIWNLNAHLAARDAELFRRQMLLDGAFRVIAVLSAVNRLYFTKFQFKRARALIDRMTVKPEGLAETLDFIANAPPSDAAEELRKLYEATKAIVQAEMPDLDINRPWRPDV
jgi:predicted nucleotidyltransferase